MPVVAGSRKKMPFEPLSRKLSVTDWASKRVVNVPFGDSVRTFAPASPLLDCVPIPKIMEPLTPAAPDDGIDGSSMTTPWLLSENREIGFCSCSERGAATSTHPVVEHA